MDIPRRPVFCFCFLFFAVFCLLVLKEMVKAWILGERNGGGRDRGMEERKLPSRYNVREKNKHF